MRDDRIGTGFAPPAARRGRGVALLRGAAAGLVLAMSASFAATAPAQTPKPTRPPLAGTSATPAHRSPATQNPAAPTQARPAAQPAKATPAKPAAPLATKPAPAAPAPRAPSIPPPAVQSLPDYPPPDTSVPPAMLPRAPRERMRSCAAEWSRRKLESKGGLPLWRDFATECLTKK